MAQKNKYDWQWVNLDDILRDGAEEPYTMFEAQRRMYEEMFNFREDRKRPETSWVKKDPVFKQCIADAKEYFDSIWNPTWQLISNRKRLSPADKERVVEFLKSRKKYYDKEGLLL